MYKYIVYRHDVGGTIDVLFHLHGNSCENNWNIEVDQ